MTGKQKNRSKATTICPKCGREFSNQGFYHHQLKCDGDPDKAVVKSQRSLEDEPETIETEVNTTVTPIVEEPVSMPVVHTTVPLNPSTNEHGGIVKSEDAVPEQEPQNEDDDEWDGYLC